MNEITRDRLFGICLGIIIGEIATNISFLAPYRMLLAIGGIVVCVYFWNKRKV